jgi:ribosomal protein S18 acetylase RimI-like enzyme
MHEQLNVVELIKNDPLPILEYSHLIQKYYDVSVICEVGTWTIKLILKSFDAPIEKKDQSKLFEPYIEEPRVFVAEVKCEQVGWIEVGYQKWNNRLRVWEFLVKEGFRRQGIGKLLMDKAVEVARKKGARMVVLETQSWNVNAIDFYVNYGFELIGLDTYAYSNRDIEKKDVRLEFGLELN